MMRKTLPHMNYLNDRQRHPSNYSDSESKYRDHSRYGLDGLKGSLYSVQSFTALPNSFVWQVLGVRSLRPRFPRVNCWLRS